MSYISTRQDYRQLRGGEIVIERCDSRDFFVVKVVRDGLVISQVSPQTPTLAVWHAQVYIREGAAMSETSAPLFTELVTAIAKHGKRDWKYPAWRDEINDDSAYKGRKR